MRYSNFVGWIACLLASVGAQASADSYAYMGTGNSVYNFGVVDITSGDFSLCGSMDLELSGLGVGPDHNIYGGAFYGNGFYRVDVTTGKLKLVGKSAISFFLTGSTPKGLYAVGTDSNLYSVDYTAGNATLIGPIGITVSDTGW